MIEELLGRYRATRAAFDATSKFLQMQVRGLGDEDRDDDAEGGDDAQFLPQLGVSVRPIVARTLRALAVRWGAELWILKLWDRAKQPTDLDEGETRVWCVGDNRVRIRLRSTGIDIEANGADVTVNGGNLKVARRTDAVQVTIPAGSFLIAASGGGTLNPDPVTVDGTITGACADHFTA